MRRFNCACFGVGKRCFVKRITMIIIALLCVIPLGCSSRRQPSVEQQAESATTNDVQSDFDKPYAAAEDLNTGKEPSGANREHPVTDNEPEGPDRYFAAKSFVYGNTSGNIANGGMVAMQDDRIYFANAQDQSRLYSINTDGSDYRKLLHYRARAINIYDDRVYYIGEGNYSGEGISCVELNGNDERTLTYEKPDCLNIVNGKVYFINRRDGLNIFIMDLTGENRQRLNYDVSGNLMVVGGRIYYTNEDDGGRIYSMDISGGYRKKINDDKSGCLNVIGDRIYYVNYDDNGAIYGIGIDGDERIKINDEPSGHINVSGDRIYYVSFADDQSIYSMSTGGEDREKLNDVFSKNINIAGGRIFYLSENDTLHTMKTDGSDGQSVFEWATSAPIPDSPITLGEVYKLYSDFIIETVKNNPSNDYDWGSVSLIYIADDNIPALVVRSSSEYSYRLWLCTASSGKLQSVLVDSIHYIEYGNLISSGAWGNRNSDIIHTIPNGEFVVVHEGHYIYKGQGEWPENYTWYWDDQEVPYSEYRDKRDAAFDTSKASYPRFEYSATAAIRLLRGEPALTDGEARALVLAQTWLEDHDVYLDYADSFKRTLTWRGEEYYLIGSSNISNYWFGILVHTRTDEMLFRFSPDGPIGYVLIRPLYDYCFDDGSLAKQTTFDDAVLNTPDYLTLLIKWDDGSYTTFLRGYYETVWAIYDDDYVASLVNPVFSYRGEAFTLAIPSDSERYYLYENGHGTFGDKTFTWSYYIFGKQGMW